MTRILFVDDEANALDGLRRMLRSRRRTWDMVFVQSALQGIKAMKETPFDVIVSDIRMPGMDGIAFLEQVRQTSPETVRIALSGHADREATLHAVRHIHQFLAKPCDAATLKHTLARAIALRGLLNDTRLRELVSQMESLPSLPVLFDQVVRELEAPDASLRSVGQVIAQDIAMSAKLLQLVNSAFFGLTQHVSSPAQATVLLGLDTIRTLVLSIRIFEALDGKDFEGLSIENLWQHSVDVGRLAKRLATAEAAEDEAAEDAFLAGLLHDIGKLIFAVNLPAKYRSALKLAGPNPKTTSRVEEKIIGATHGEVGAYLVGLWGFSDQLIEAIAYHHEPSASLMRIRGEEETFSPLAAVHIANTLLQAHAENPSPEDTPNYTLDMEYVGRVASAERIPVWQRMCQQIIKEDGSRD